MSAAGGHSGLLGGQEEGEMWWRGRGVAGVHKMNDARTTMLHTPSPGRDHAHTKALPNEAERGGCTIANHLPPVSGVL